MTEPMRYLSPRLVDYVAVVGHCEPTADEGGLLLPQLLRRYPVDDHPDFPLPPDTAFFCQPDGCLNAGLKQLSHLRESYSFVFALTEKDSGRRRYGTCLNFYRPFRRRSHGGSSSSSSSGLHHRQLAGTSRRGSPAAAATAAPDSHKSQPGGSKEPPVPAARQLRTHTLTSLCIISHHGLFSSFRECLRILRRLVNACNAHLNGCHKTARVPKNTVWNFLVGKLTEVPSAALPYIRELEMFILRLLSVPVPAPGKTRLELHLLPPELASPPLIVALPDHTRFSLVDFPLHLPLELLGVEQCIKVLECIVLEQKVLLQSHDHNALSMSVMALIVMLYPLEYMFPVIPLLPTCMESAEQLLLAPTPFVIGVPASFLQQRQGFSVPDDVWIVDLDANSVSAPTAKGCELPSLPEPEIAQLRTYLKQSLSCLSLASQPVKNLDALLESSPSQAVRRKPSEMGLSFNPFVFGNDVDSVDVATRVALVHFLCSPNVLANFQEHVRVLRLYPRPVVAFQLNSFLRSRPNPSAFTDRLARTQAIEFFAEWALNPTNVAFMRVLTGVYDPTVVGDKVRWYGHHLQHATCSLLPSASALTQLLSAAKDPVEDLTDESGESEEEHVVSRRVSNGSTEGQLLAKSRAHSAEGAMQLTTVTERDVFNPPMHLHGMSAADTCPRAGGRPISCDRSDSEDSVRSDRETASDSESGPTDGDSIDMPSLPKLKVRPARSKLSRPPIVPSVRKRNLSAPNPKVTDQGDNRVPLSPSSLLSNLGNDIGSYAMSASSKLSGFLGKQQVLRLKAGFLSVL